MALNVLAIVQARMGSTRLPGKVLKEVGGKALIEILLHRLSQSKKIDKIVLATGENEENEILSETVARSHWRSGQINPDRVVCTVG